MVHHKRNKAAARKRGAHDAQESAVQINFTKRYADPALQQDYLAVARQPLTPTNYVEKFTALLKLEELQLVLNSDFTATTGVTPVAGGADLDEDTVLVWMTLTGMNARKVKLVRGSTIGLANSDISAVGFVTKVDENTERVLVKVKHPDFDCTATYRIRIFFDLRPIACQHAALQAIPRLPTEHFHDLLFPSLPPGQSLRTSPIHVPFEENIVHFIAKVASPDSKVLVCAQNNANVDRVTSDLIRRMGEQAILRVNRLSPRDNIPDDVFRISLLSRPTSHHDIDLRFRAPEMVDIQNISVLTSTCVSAFRIPQNTHISHIVFVEESYLMETECLIPIVLFWNESLRVVIEGQERGEPVVHHEGASGLARSLGQRLIGLRKEQLLQREEEQRAEVRRAERAREQQLMVERERRDAQLRVQMEAQREEAQRLEAQRLEAQRLEAQRLKAQRLEAQRLEAQRLEAQRLEVQRLRAQRLEAQRVEAQRAEAQRLEARRLEAQRVEARWLEAQRVEAERAEAERLQALRQKQDQEDLKKIQQRREIRRREREAEAKREARRNKKTPCNVM